MQVLVDSSVWIDYFRSGDASGKLDYLIDTNCLVTNQVILTELIPSLRIHRKHTLIGLLQNIRGLELTINWETIRDYQYRCLKKGMNGIGIPDLIIASNAIQHDCYVYSLDKHFPMMAQAVPVRLMER